MAFFETSLEEECREVRDSVLEYLESRPDRDGQAACSLLLRHLAGYDVPQVWTPPELPPDPSRYPRLDRLP